MNKLLLFLLVFCFSKPVFSSRGDLRVMFYNVENIFDTYDDPNTLDDEFTPEGIKKWTVYRYNQKLQHIFKVIASAGEWKPPEIIGLCEIENGKVLHDLIHKTPLYKYDYKFVQYDSPDRRGIDVACLYNSAEIRLISSEKIPVISTSDTAFKTRDILCVKFETKMHDTLYVMINHWPSRRGGQYRSDSKRMLASQTLSNYLNKTVNVNSHVVIMGDFNDGPVDSSVMGLYTASNILLKNISEKQDQIKGTLKYQGTWNLFDQFIVSQRFYLKENKLYLQNDAYKICPFEFLLKTDEAYSGEKPFPTYTGPAYKGGFSDHLPVYIDLWFKK